MNKVPKTESLRRMAGRNFYRSARRPLGLANEASGNSQNKRLGIDDSLNLSEVIRMASKTTESQDQGDSELSGLSDAEQADLHPARHDTIVEDSPAGAFRFGSEMYYFHSTPNRQSLQNSSHSSVSTSSSQSLFEDILLKQSELIQELLDKQKQLSETVAAVHDDLRQTKTHLSQLADKEKENVGVKYKRCYPSVLTVSYH